MNSTTYRIRNRDDVVRLREIANGLTIALRIDSHFTSLLRDASSSPYDLCDLCVVLEPTALSIEEVSELKSTFEYLEEQRKVEELHLKLDFNKKLPQAIENLFRTIGRLSFLKKVILDK